MSLPGTKLAEVRASLTRLNRIAVVSVALFVFGVGGWAWAVNLSGAVLAAGQVVVEGSLRRVQHPSGGVVGQILVPDLGLAECRHDRDAVPDEILDRLGDQIGALLQQGGNLVLILGVQRIGARQVRDHLPGQEVVAAVAAGMAGGAPCVEDLLAVGLGLVQAGLFRGCLVLGRRLGGRRLFLGRGRGGAAQQQGGRGKAAERRRQERAHGLAPL